MSGKTEPRVPHGHGYCWHWSETKRSHCTLPKNHNGDHAYPYAADARRR